MHRARVVTLFVSETMDFANLPDFYKLVFMWVFLPAFYEIEFSYFEALQSWNSKKNIAEKCWIQKTTTLPSVILTSVTKVLPRLSPVLIIPPFN